MADPLQTTLDATDLPKAVKAQVWDAYHGSETPEKFKSLFDPLNIPKPLKAQLWDLRFKDAGVSKTPQVDGVVKQPQFDATKPTRISSDTKLQRMGRGLYAEIPSVTAAIGGGLAAAPFIAGAPFTEGASAFAAPTAALTGAGVGAMVGHGIQHLIDRITGGATKVSGTFGSEATKQMELQAVGEGTASLVGTAGGKVLDRMGVPTEVTQRLERLGQRTPTAHVSRVPMRPAAGSAAEEALRTNEEFKLGLSTPEITGGPAGRMAQWAGTRSISGQVLQSKIRAEGDKSAAKAVGRILDVFGPATTEIGAGSAAQESVQGAATRAGRRVEGAIATKIAPETGAAAAGRTTEAGVKAARQGFTEVQRQYAQILKDSPKLDMRDVKQRAWSIFREQVLPTLISFPALGPKTPAFEQLRNLGLKQSFTEVDPASLKVLESDAIKKLNSPVMTTLRRILTANQVVPFQDAADFRSILRSSGKAPDELLADKAKGVATTLSSELRRVMAEASPAWDAAAQAYGPDARLFQSKFVRNLIAKDPETVLAGLGGAQGRQLSSRVRKLGKLLLDVSAKSPNAADAAQGREAWNTLRAQWLRREVFQGDVFGMSERLGKVDPDVLRAWFPDAAGKDVLARARQAAGQFESSLIRDLATQDPSKTLEYVGATAKRINETRSVLHAHPETGGPEAWQRLQRAKVQSLVGDDYTKIADRIAKLDPEERRAWFGATTSPTETPNAAALAERTPTRQVAAYRSAEQAAIRGTQADISQTAAGRTLEAERRSVMTPTAQVAPDGEKTAALQRGALSDLERIGRALSRRTNPPMGSIYKAIEFAHIGGEVFRGNVFGGLKLSSLYEGVPGFITWAVYNPTIRKMLVSGVEADDPKVAMLMLTRAVDAYKQAKQSQATAKTGAGSPAEAK